jgi:predicted transcriptional regulator
MIRQSKPQSLTELAKMSGRAKTNLSRTLHTMQSLGLVELHEAPKGKKVPMVRYDKLKFEFPLTPRRSKAA